MPLLELTLPTDALTDRDAHEVVERLAETLLHHEEAPIDSPVVREIIWCYVHRSDTMPLAGTRPAPRYLIEVTVPVGMLDDEAKAHLVADLTDVLQHHVDDPVPDFPFPVWCLIHEIADGNWGANGRIYRRNDIANLVYSDPRAVSSPD